MASSVAIQALFLDLGGVMLTNGWDRAMRERAAQEFGLDLEEVNERHHLTFDTYEIGKLNLDEYLDRVIFYEPRRFGREQFKAFMFAQSRHFPEMIELIRRLKEEYCFRVAAVSNEGRELAVYRIQKFDLQEFIDFFIISSFVHFRKPDADIFRLALDVAQVSADHVAYLEDRAMFVQVAQDLGLRAIRHTDYASTRKQLQELGLKDNR
jgi:putative hydrolase of the HAD superfamily